MHDRFLKRLPQTFWSIPFCLSLCACSTTSETFDCKPGKGVGCKSITEVNQMVNNQEPGGSGQGLEAPLSDDFFVHRIPEEHLKVWVAPFQDEGGNLHEGSVIHTVLKPGHWQLKDSRVRDALSFNGQEAD